MKKLISIILLLVLTLSLCAPSFASTDEPEDAFCIDNYIQYTINLTEQNPNMRSENGDSIDAAIDYVESLGLEDIGYSYIEEACLCELNGYKEDGVVLENYTVLVPKTRTKFLFGTYANSKFYYEYTSVANMRRDTIGSKKSNSNEIQWEKWILGVADLGMCFAQAQWSVPYALFRTVTGVSNPSSVHYGSYNQYVEQFEKTVTRTIFKEKNGFVPCYQDQTASLRVKMYFCPVGTAFSKDFYDIGTVYDGAVGTNNYTKDQILKSANINANHGGMAVHKVTSYRVVENWSY